MRSSERYVARKPANTRATFSLQIGMTTAVRAAGSIGAAPDERADTACRSSPKTSTRKPAIAVQNPAETQAKSTTKSASSAASSGRS